MTTITIDRAVVEQALEALELGYDTAKAEADRYHVAMAGFRPERHARLDAEVQQIAAAITNLRAALAQQRLTDAQQGMERSIESLKAALAQQAEPVEPRRWEGDHNVESPFNACMHKSYCITLKQALAQQAEPVQALNAWAADRLARHGIQACLYPQCVGGQSGTVCHKRCPTPCLDCRGLGYDASGQLCACQQNPSF